MTLAAGTRLGPYEIVAALGAGGMGDVYKARDTRLDRLVAIKVSKEQFSDRFEREARAVAALNHAHICQIYDVGPNYLVMELVEGVPLKGPLPLRKTIEYAGQILEALDAAHRKGIIHRDLKPSNILVTKQGVKLLDFGLAKQSGRLPENEATLTAGLTGKGQIVGTLQYMSPEQLQGKEADARSDLFSFGCVLYEMLSGKRAFEGQSAASVIAAIIEREPAPLDLAPPLERVIRTCLAKDPDRRFQNALDLSTALQWAVEQPASASTTRRSWIIAAAAVLALGSLGGWGITRFRQPLVDDRILRFPLNLPEGGQLVLGTNRGGIALSPDGKTAAFVANTPGKIGIWIQRMDGTPARLIPGTEGAAYPFWSPDGKSLAFFEESGTKLARVDVTGAGLLTICEMPAVERGGTWIEGGQIVFGTLGSGLFRVPAAGGTPAPLTTLDTSADEVGHAWPQVLPHGRVLYWVQSNRQDSSGVYVASLSKPGDRARLLTTNETALYAPAGGRDHLLWLRGRTLVAQDFDPGAPKLSGELYTLADALESTTLNGHLNAAVSATGLLLYSTSSTVSQFIWMDRTGKRLGTVSDTGDYTTFRLSPDGRRAAVAMNSVGGGSDLWILELERSVATRLTSRTGNNLFAVWSPDGGTILFQSGGGSIFRKAASGASEDQLIASSTNTRAPLDWSRDGRSLLYFEIVPGTNRDLWILPMTPDGKFEPNEARPYLRTRFSEWHGRFSRELSPKWVAYQSNESGRFEVYVDSFPEPHNKIRISTEGGQFPQWGPGGRELFYVSPDYKLMSVSLKLATGSFEPSTPRELFQLPAIDDGLSSPYEAAPDGQRFLVRAAQQQQQAPQSLTVLVNWPALLKKGSAAQ